MDELMMDEFDEDTDPTMPDAEHEQFVEAEEDEYVSDAEDNLPGSIRSGLAAIGLLLIVGAIFVNRGAAILSFVVAFVVAAAIPLLVVELRRARMHRLAATGMLLGIAVIVAQLLLFALYPAWQGKLATYSGNLVTLAKTVMDKINTTGESGGNTTFDNHTVDETLRDARETATKVKRKTTGFVEDNSRDFVQRVHNATEIVFFDRLLLALQFSLFLVGLCAIQYCFPEPEPVAANADPQAPAPRGYWRRKVCAFCLVRTAKGLIIAAVTAIGLCVGGINTWFFIAGLAMVIAIISSFAPPVAIVLAIVMIPLAASWQWALGAVIVTALLLVAAEKRLHWYLVVMPGIQGGHLPPAFYKKPKRAVTTIRQGRSPGRLLFGALELCFSLALIAVLAGTVYIGYQGATAAAERDKALVDARNQHRDKDYAKSIAAYEAVRVQHPNNRAAILGLAQSHAMKGNMSKGLEYAEDFATWQPSPAPDTSDPVNFLRHKMGSALGWIELPQYQRGLAYEQLLSVAERSGEHILQITERLLRLDERNLRAHSARASAAVENSDWESAADWARKGIEIDDAYPGFHGFLARALYAQDDLEGCVNAADLEIKIDPENGIIEALRNRAQGELAAPPAEAPEQ
ncbi:MAG: putative PurR-regulated permease PerM [Rhodothermales bacterium]|jgi:predicted PurR-regulated permease PerM